MRMGALLVPGDGADAATIATQAKNIEAAGYDGVWSAQAMGRGFMMHDPFISLTTAAAVTDRVELGVAILQLPLYNATDVALKSLSLAQVSDGRFILGVGAGSTETDYGIHRQDFAARFQLFNEKVTELKEAFEEGTAGGGSLSTWAAVKAPQLAFGTWGKNVARAATEFDVWIASGMHRSPAECAAALKGYRASGGNRAIVSTIGVMPDTDLGKLREDLNIYAEAGFDDAVVMVIPGGHDIETVRSLV